MADKLTIEQRSALMSRIRSKNTKPEIAVRQFLHSRGFRFRLHDKKLPGTPDIVLPKYRTVVFVNGCLWHGHFWCRRFKMPKSRPEYWRPKIRMNKKRDRAKKNELRRTGWKVITVWECETAAAEALEARMTALTSAIANAGKRRAYSKREMDAGLAIYRFSIRSLAARVVRPAKRTADRILKAILPRWTKGRRRSSPRKDDSRKRT